MRQSPDIYLSFAGAYVEAGFRVMPVAGKRPYEDAWWQGACARDTCELADEHGAQHADKNIGLAMGVEYDLDGQTYALIGIDFDYLGYLEKEHDGLTADQLRAAEEHAVEATQEAYQLLPDTPLMKIGRKGFTGLYLVPADEFAGTTRIEGVLDVLGAGTQTVVPPSIHPDTNEPYRWYEDFQPTGQELPAYGPDDATVLPVSSLMVFLRFCHELRAGLQRIELSDDELDEAVRKTLSGEAALRYRAGSAYINDQARFQLWRWIGEAIGDWPNFKVEKFVKVGAEMRPNKWVVTNMLRESGQGRADHNRKPNFHPRMNWKSDATGKYASLRDHAAGGTNYSPVAFIMGVLEGRRSGDRSKVLQVLDEKQRRCVNEAEQWLVERIDLDDMELRPRKVAPANAEWRRLEALSLERARSVETWRFTNSFMEVCETRALAHRARAFTDQRISDAELRSGAAHMVILTGSPIMPSLGSFDTFKDEMAALRQRKEDIEVLHADHFDLADHLAATHAPIHQLAITVGAGKTFSAMERSVSEVIRAMTHDCLSAMAGLSLTTKPSKVIHLYFPDTDLKNEKLEDVRGMYVEQVRTWIAGGNAAWIASEYGLTWSETLEAALCDWLNPAARVGSYAGIDQFCGDAMDRLEAREIEFDEDTAEGRKAKVRAMKMSKDETFRRRHAHRRNGGANEMFCRHCPLRQSDQCGYWEQDLGQAAIVCLPHAMLTTHLPEHAQPMGHGVYMGWADESPINTFTEMHDLRPHDLIGPRSFSNDRIAGAFYRCPKPRKLLAQIIAEEDWRETVTPIGVKDALLSLKRLEERQVAARRLYGGRDAARSWERLDAGTPDPDEPDEDEVPDQKKRKRFSIAMPRLRRTIMFLEAIYRVTEPDLKPWQERALPYPLLRHIKRAKTKAGKAGIVIKDGETGKTQTAAMDALSVVEYKFIDGVREPAEAIDRERRIEKIMLELYERRKDKSGQTPTVIQRIQDHGHVPPKMPRTTMPICVLNATGTAKDIEHTFKHQPGYHSDLVSVTQVRVELPENARIYQDVSSLHHSRTSYGIGLTEGSSKQQVDRAVAQCRRLVTLCHHLVRWGEYKVLVVGPKQLAGDIVLPHGATWRDNGKITGSNAFRGFDFVIVVSGNEPDYKDIERQAEALKGAPLERYLEHGFVRYVPHEAGKVKYGQIVEMDGWKHHAAPKRDHVHPDEDAEAVRERVTNSLTEQAWGRLRAALRAKDGPIACYLMTSSETREPPTHGFDSKAYDDISPQAFINLMGIEIDLTRYGAKEMALILAAGRWRTIDALKKAQQRHETWCLPDVPMRTYQNNIIEVPKARWQARGDVEGRLSEVMDLYDPDKPELIGQRDHLRAKLRAAGKRSAVWVTFKSQAIMDQWLGSGLFVVVDQGWRQDV